MACGSHSPSSERQVAIQISSGDQCRWSNRIESVEWIRMGRKRFLDGIGGHSKNCALLEFA